MDIVVDTVMLSRDSVRPEYQFSHFISYYHDCAVLGVVVF